MKSHKLYEVALKRGDAALVDKEMGYRSNGEIARSWRREPACPDNLSTGRKSPLVKGKQELLAHDRVNPEAADILLFDLFAAVALQRATRTPETMEGDEKLAVMRALAQGFLTACEALAGPLSLDEQEEKLWRAGGAVVRALLFVAREDKNEGVAKAA